MFKFNAFDVEEVKVATVGTCWFAAEGDAVLRVIDIRGDVLILELFAPWARGLIFVDRSNLA